MILLCVMLPFRIICSNRPHQHLRRYLPPLPSPESLHHRLIWSCISRHCFHIIVHFIFVTDIHSEQNESKAPPPTTTMEKYEKLLKLGEGAHGVVTKARVRSKEEIIEARKAEKKYATARQEALKVSPGVKRKREEEEAADEEVIIVHEEKKEAGGDDTELDEDELDELAEMQLPAAPGTIVAIKKIRLRSAQEGISMEAIRELKLLAELHHPNVIGLLDVFHSSSNVSLVLEYMTGDLEAIIRARATSGKTLSAADCKAYMRMLLEGIAHCHSNFIMHRDLKPGNLLIGGDGCLKIADFGLGKLFGSPDRRQSPQACTIWYRAPELLFGATTYGSAADMWSVGAIMGEMLWLKPMFAGPESELAQLQRIFALLGTPSTSDWPNVHQLRHYIAFKPQNGRPLRELFPAVSADAIELLAGLLTLNPAKRMTAQEALNHRYFRNPPAPTPLANLPNVRREKEQAKAREEEQKAKRHAGRASGRVLSFD